MLLIDERRKWNARDEVVLIDPVWIRNSLTIRILNVNWLRRLETIRNGVESSFVPLLLASLVEEWVPTMREYLCMTVSMTKLTSQLEQICFTWVDSLARHDIC